MLNGLNQINQVNPGVFFYWVKVTAVAGSNTFTINQSITTGNFSKCYGIQAGSNVYNSNCNTVMSTVTNNGCATTVQFNAPTAGTYIIAVKFDATTIKNQPAPSPGTTVHSDFSTTGVPNSTSGLDLKKKVM